MMATAEGVNSMTMSLRAAMFGGVLAALALVPAPAVAQAPSADTMAAARELVIASRAGDQVKALLPLIVQQIKPLVVQNRPEIERDFDTLMPLMMEMMNAQLGEFTDAMALIYARNFTADELRQIQGFYGTPAGQKLLDKLPAITQESFAVGNKFGQGIANQLRGKVIEELRKRGHNI
jgi:uncharacterized protein